jgi:YbdK family carboxylate-amine ligase
MDRPQHPVPTADAVGATLGVEEEYHLVEPVGGAVARRPALAEAAASGCVGEFVQGEIQNSQLEVATRICQTVEDVRSALVAARRAAAEAASTEGAAILASGTHPFAPWREFQRVRSQRYDALADRFGALVDRQGICGCHVHVGVPDFDLALRIMNHARAYLPLLAALTSSSPFHDGVDTGFASFRTMWWSTWPTSGPPPLLRSVTDYDRLVGELVATGLIEDATTLYWDLRPSTRFPTLEFRVADVCSELDDAVLHAALARSLVRCLATRVKDGRPAPEVSHEVLLAARWQAARYGLRGDLRDPATGSLLPAPLAVRRLLTELEPDLREHGEFDEVRALVRALLLRGTSADRQRARFAEQGNLADVVTFVRGVTVAAIDDLPGPVTTGALALEPDEPRPMLRPPSAEATARGGRWSPARRRSPRPVAAHPNERSRST